MLSGAIAGVFILGLVGKFAMALISILIDSSMNLSFLGISEALMIGTGLGVIGGLLHLCISRVEYFSKGVQGVVLGAILFALSIIISILFTKMKTNFTGTQFLTLTTIFGVYIMYGITVVTLMNWIRFRYSSKPFKA